MLAWNISLRRNKPSSTGKRNRQLRSSQAASGVKVRLNGYMQMLQTALIILQELHFRFDIRHQISSPYDGDPGTEFELKELRHLDSH